MMLGGKRTFILLFLLVNVHAFYFANETYRDTYIITSPQDITNPQISLNISWNENMRPDFGDIRFTYVLEKNANMSCLLIEGHCWHHFFEISLNRSLQRNSLIKIDINAEKIKTSGFNNSLEARYNVFWSLINDDCTNIRVTNGSSQLGFWISKCNKNKREMTVWVNATAGTSKIILAYGNSSASQSSFEGIDFVFSAQQKHLEIKKVTVPSLGPSLDEWYCLNFTNPFPEPPVVIIGPDTTFHGSDEISIRIKNITNEGFCIKLLEPSNRDGTHASENVTYLAIPPGDWITESGIRIIADEFTTHVWLSGDTGSEPQITHITFNTSFTGKPIVLSQIQDFTYAGFAHTREKDVTKDGFSVAPEPEGGVTSPPSVNVTIGWIAVEPSSGEIGPGAIFETGEIFTDRCVVDPTWQHINFQFSYSQPRFIAGLTSYNGGDSAGLRAKQLTSTGIYVGIEEDTTYDSEKDHTSEYISYLVVDGDNVIKLFPLNLTGHFTFTSIKEKHLVDTEVPLPCWIEEYNDSNYAIFWTKVPFLNSTKNNTLYVYYGNSGLNYEPRPDDVFLFFDDFEDESLDTSKWDTSGASGNYQETDGVLKLWRNWGGCCDASCYYTSIDSKQEFPTNISVYLKFRMNPYQSRSGCGRTGVAILYDSRSEVVTSTDSTGTKGLNLRIGSSHITTGYSLPEGWQKMKIDILSDSLVVTGSWFNGTVSYNKHINGPASVGLAGDTDTTTNKDEIDYVFVTNYVENLTINKIKSEFKIMVSFPTDYRGELSGQTDFGTFHLYILQNNSTYRYYWICPENTSFPEIYFRSVRFLPNSSLTIQPVNITISPEEFNLTAWVRVYLIQPNFSFSNYTVIFQNTSGTLEAFVCKQNCSEKTNWYKINYTKEGNNILITLNSSDPIIALGNLSTPLNITYIYPKDGANLDEGEVTFVAVVNASTQPNCTLFLNNSSWTAYPMNVSQVNSTQYNCSYSLLLSPGMYSFYIYVSTPSENISSEERMFFVSPRSRNASPTTARAPEGDDLLICIVLVSAACIVIKERFIKRQE